ncbi:MULTISPECIES: hypothetical protein [Halomonadaceae]|uniref:hypothetical protein n=1 Tax=Halomonadaceae TaxID=28256 RepID=UPI001ABF2E08|nr:MULTISPECIES: hypothetical protein [Halomonas]
MNRAYISLGAFYSLLVLLGVVALLMGGGSLLSLVQLGIGGMAVVGLWGYTLKKGFLNPRVWRPLAFVLGAAVVGQLLLVFFASLSNTEITWMLISAVFSALLVAILYQYGDRDQELWASWDDIVAGRVLGDLLAKHETLTVEKQEGERHATVTLSTVGERYRARVIRCREGSREEFEERFASLATLADFIETYTCITVKDFAKHYSGSSSRTADYGAGVPPHAVAQRGGNPSSEAK